MEKIAFMKSVNFEFLRPGNELLTNLAGLAEAVLHIDPGSSLTRLRSNPFWALIDREIDALVTADLGKRP